TEKIGANRFLDKNLIRHIDYYECLYWYQANNEPDTYRRLLPRDTTVRFDGKILWRNPEFEDYPIAGLSREQAELYCAWRSMAVNRMKSNRDKRSCNTDYWSRYDRADPEDAYRVCYQLPEAGDLAQRKPRQEKYWLPEYTAAGQYDRKISGRYSDPAGRVFRCVAIFEKK
ncbi:MAG: hypothetical protein JNK89_10470, partial [Saprospiraceae bacterium]|nr:hypothetical protein [Saprospiraceae bacterium]